eukprot:8178826-Alexandrium_andersonii.AAC.1
MGNSRLTDPERADFEEHCPAKSWTAKRVAALREAATELIQEPAPAVVATVSQVPIESEDPSEAPRDFLWLPVVCARRDFFEGSVF